MRCEIYIAARKWEAALDTAAALIQLEPEDPQGWFHRSYALHELKLTAEARDNLLRVVDKFRNQRHGTLQPRVLRVPVGPVGAGPELA